MDDVRTHADHVDIHVPVKQDVVGQIFYGLAGQAAHVAGADLIANGPQRVEAVLADLPLMMAVLRMKLSV